MFFLRVVVRVFGLGFLECFLKTLAFEKGLCGWGDQLLAMSC